MKETVLRDSAQQSALAGAVLAISGIKKASIIIHASSGCGWTGRWMRSEHPLNYVPLIATSLLENELIFGGKEKLRRTIDWVMEHWKPQLLFILTGDSGSLINDPVEAIAFEREKSSKIPILCLDVPYFKGLAAVGVDDVYRSLLERFARKDVPKKKDTINLIAPYLSGSSNWPFDLEEVVRLLQGIGLSINCILTSNTSLEELSMFYAAETDLYLTYEVFPQLATLEDEKEISRFGLDLPLPIGVYNTEEWLFGIASKFGKEEEAKRLIENEKKHLAPLRFLYNATWLQTWLSNQSAAVIGPASWASSFSRFLYFDLNVYPKVIALYGDSDDPIEYSKNILKDVQGYLSPIVLENPLYIEVAQAIKEAEVEFSIGQTQEKSLVEGIGVSHLSLAGLYSILGTYNFIPFPSMGFKGVLYLLTMLGRLVEETFHEPQRWQELRFRGREE